MHSIVYYLQWNWLNDYVYRPWDLPDELLKTFNTRSEAMANHLLDDYTGYNTPDGTPVEINIRDHKRYFIQTGWNFANEQSFQWKGLSPRRENDSCAAALYNPTSNRLTWVAVNCQRRYEDVLPVCQALSSTNDQKVVQSKSCPKYFVGFKHPEGNLECLMIFDVGYSDKACSEFGGRLAFFVRSLFNKYKDVFNQWVDDDLNGVVVLAGTPRKMFWSHVTQSWEIGVSNVFPGEWSHVLCETDAVRERSSCPRYLFQCHDKSCILPLHRCDGNADCASAEDEVKLIALCAQ
jgi:hypothetical protein